MEQIVRIKKVRVLPEQIMEICKKNGLQENDIVILRIEKIEGSPIEYLQKDLFDVLKDD